MPVVANPTSPSTTLWLCHNLGAPKCLSWLFGDFSTRFAESHNLGAPKCLSWRFLDKTFGTRIQVTTWEPPNACRGNYSAATVASCNPSQLGSPQMPVVADTSFGVTRHLSHNLGAPKCLSWPSELREWCDSLVTTWEPPNACRGKWTS